MSTFFNLCPDILLNIFTYFSLNELYDVFIDVIPYLSRLLVQGHVKLSIRKSFNSLFWDEFLPRFDLKQVISLTIISSELNDINLSQFSSLRSITLENFQVIHSMNQLYNLPYLERFTIKLAETILNEDSWLSDILRLPTLKQLRIALMNSKTTLQPQKQILISQRSLPSLTIQYLHVNIPLSWSSIIVLLQHFPVLQAFRANLYQIKSILDDTLLSRPDLTCINSLRTVHLTGYFSDMLSIITNFCSPIPHLKNCRLLTTTVTNDQILQIITTNQYFTWNELFEFSKHLTQVRIHILMSIESKKGRDIDDIKYLVHKFNDTFLRRYNLYVITTSMHNGYITLTCDFNKRKKLTY